MAVEVSIQCDDCGGGIGLTEEVTCDQCVSGYKLDIEKLEGEIVELKEIIKEKN